MSSRYGFPCATAWRGSAPPVGCGRGRGTDPLQIADMGAYVKLLEYDNIDGMILLSELSRRRIRSIQKLIRVGRNEVVVVLRVDKEKGWAPRSCERTGQPY